MVLRNRGSFGGMKKTRGAINMEESSIERFSTVALNKGFHLCVIPCVPTSVYFTVPSFLGLAPEAPDFNIV